MPSVTSVENNFTKGLLTEFTGLNFPENAATDADNCLFTLVGDVTRRQGIDFEDNFQLNQITTAEQAVNTYKWNNAGGDGETQVIVEQVGNKLYFYKSSAATAANPLSTQKLASTIGIGTFTAAGATFDPTVECTFADGNGYLFVYHPTCAPFYCTYISGSIAGHGITVQIRDFTGVSEPGFPVTNRPLSLSSEHLYNLQNQGWTQGSPWSSNSNTSITVNTGNFTFTVAAGLTGVVPGQAVSLYTLIELTPGGLPVIPAGTSIMSGNVISYSGTSLIINITNFLSEMFLEGTGPVNIVPTDVGFINTWFSDIGNYPSNSDVWWYYKDSTDIFNPTTQVGSVNLNNSQAPQGHYILPAFNQDRSLVTGIGLNIVSTIKRPSNGAWFQGRVWYTGVNAQQPAVGDALYYTWTENIYFSQVVQTVNDFGSCFQSNDPTSEHLFDLLPTDGGVITIQGAGAIYKLFPIQNGMLVFAANGVWFITGSQGIGFSANDYTITKLSAVTSISSTSFVDVLGLPYFWNEEGIYSVQPQQSGGLTVAPLTVGTIETFYDAIPRQCKQFVRGAYHPIEYVIQWVYNDIPDDGNITTRYSFNNILNYNTYNKAFYAYTIADGTPAINGVIYVSSPGGLAAPDPVFKYPTTVVASPTLLNITFSEENSLTYKDWFTFDGVGVDYTSFFVTGFRLRGQAQRRFQTDYIYVFSRADTTTQYYIQGMWDYATVGNSGRWSTAQFTENWNPNFGMIIRRHKIRGRGLVLQLRVTSVTGQPFDIMGWSTLDTVNAGV